MPIKSISELRIKDNQRRRNKQKTRLKNLDDGKNLNLLGKQKEKEINFYHTLIDLIHDPVTLPLRISPNMKGINKNTLKVKKEDYGKLNHDLKENYIKAKNIYEKHIVPLLVKNEQILKFKTVK